MEERIEEVTKGIPAPLVKELNLDECDSTFIVGLTDKFAGLESLSMNNIGLTSLKGIPKLPSLVRFEAGGNQITGGLNALLSCPKLTYINLCDNKLTGLDALEPLKALKSLKHIEIAGNPELEKINYRDELFNMIPSLKYIDGTDANGEEEGGDENGDDGGNGESDADGNSAENAEEVEDVEEDEEVEEEEEEEEGDEEDEGDDDEGADEPNVQEESEGEEYDEGEEYEEEEEEAGDEPEEEDDDEEEEDVEPQNKKVKFDSDDDEEQGEEEA